MYQEPKEFRERFDGVELCWFEWGQAKADEDSILLVHATGFHARCWDQTVSYMPNRHIVALGFGRDALAEARSLFIEQRAGELVAEELRVCQQNLSEITGEITADDLLGEIFRSFCIGK